MDNNEKVIADNLAEMQIGENRLGGQEKALESPANIDGQKKPCRNGLRPKMRLQMRMKNDMGPVPPPGFLAAPWVAGWHPRHRPGRMMNQRLRMHRPGPMACHPMQGPMINHPMQGNGPVGNVSFLHGPMWQEPPRRSQHPNCRWAAPVGNPGTYMAMFGGHQNFENSPFFMRRKLWKLAKAERNKEMAKSRPHDDVNTDQETQEPDADQKHHNKRQNGRKAAVRPFMFYHGGFPSFMMAGSKKHSKNKNEESGEEEHGKGDLASESTSGSEGEHDAEHSDDTQKPRKGDGLRRRQMRRMMMMQMMMMQNSNPFLAPWTMVGGGPQFHRGGRWKNRKQEKNPQVDGMDDQEVDEINDADLGEQRLLCDSPSLAETNREQKQCRRDCHGRRQMGRMMTPNSHPVSASQFPCFPLFRNNRSCKQHRRQRKNRQSEVQEGEQFVKDKSEEVQGERLQGEDAGVAETEDNLQKDSPSKKNSPLKKRRMQMMRRAMKMQGYGGPHPFVYRPWMFREGTKFRPGRGRCGGMQNKQ